VVIVNWVDGQLVVDDDLWPGYKSALCNICADIVLLSGQEKTPFRDSLAAGA
jgi:selenophosphate synthetase-related protein